MIQLRPTEDLAKWYAKIEDARPMCVSCGLYIVRYEGTAEVVEEGSGETGILCRACTDKADDTRYCDVDELQEETGGKEREREVTEALAQQRAERAAEFRRERAQKAARTKADKAEKAEAGSGTGRKGSGRKAGSKPRVRRPKKARDPKVRRPKR